MKSKIVLLLLVSVLLFSTILGARAENAEANGTIYIRADGSIDPPDAPISTFDNVTYTLTGNITSDVDGIVIERTTLSLMGQATRFKAQEPTHTAE